MSARPIPPFRYMEWAKARTPGPRFNLAQSGAPALSPADLGLRIEDLRFKQDGGYGDRAMLAAVSERYGVPEAEIVLATGSSLANALVFHTLIGVGDLVLVEHPCYESLATIPRMLGAEVRSIRRTPASGFAVPVGEIEQGFADGARLAVLTDLHNPSGVPTDDDDLRRVAAAAARHDAWVMIDEVYRDFRPGPLLTSRHLGERVLATSSLTKVYGLGGIRAGWAFVPEDLVRDLHRFHDYLGVVYPVPSASIAVAALARADEILDAHRAVARRGAAIAAAWIDGRDDVEPTGTGPGLICFPRITSGVSALALAERLEARHETTIAAGDAFDMPGYFRLGYGIDEGVLREGLRRVGQALDELRVS